MEIFLAVKSMTPFGGDTMVSLKICPSFVSAVNCMVLSPAGVPSGFVTKICKKQSKSIFQIRFIDPIHQNNLGCAILVGNVYVRY